jgi:hypothetical protein
LGLYRLESDKFLLQSGFELEFSIVEGEKQEETTTIQTSIGRTPSNTFMTSKTTRSSENANDKGRRFDKMMVLAPPARLGPNESWRHLQDLLHLLFFWWGFRSSGLRSDLEASPITVEKRIKCPQCGKERVWKDGIRYNP